MATIEEERNPAGEAEGEEEDDQGWEDWEEDETEGVRSLFDAETFSTVSEFLQHDIERHGFDLMATKRKLGLDQVGVIRLINYARSAMQGGGDAKTVLAALEAGGPDATFLADDAYLRPTLPGDEALFHDWEEEEEGEGEAEDPETGRAALATTAAAAAAAGGTPEAATIQEENARLREAVEGLRQMLLSEVDGPPGSRGHPKADEDRGGPRDGDAAAGGAGEPAGGAAPGPGAQATAIDASYFDSYADLGIHRAMLGDLARTVAYRDAIEKNPSSFRDKRVLDVGSGTGVLSLFAARAGAATVRGVDGSEGMARLATQIAAENGLEGSVRFIAGRVESVTDLELGDGDGEDGRVDVLLSEWMGYALLFETMLDSVLVARDRWLKPGGLMFPDVATIYIAGATAAATGLGFWDDVQGLSMRAAAEKEAAAQGGRARVALVPPSSVVTGPAVAARLDLLTMKPEDQDFTAEVALRPQANAPGDAASASPVSIAAVVVWFDTEFSSRVCPEHPVTLDTAPCKPPTHWEQVTLALERPVQVGGPGNPPYLAARVSFARDSARHRRLNIALQTALATDADEPPARALARVGAEVRLFAMGVREEDVAA